MHVPVIVGENYALMNHGKGGSKKFITRFEEFYSTSKYKMTIAQEKKVRQAVLKAYQQVQNE